MEKAESLGNENIELKKTLFNLREELTTESRERESLKIKMEEVEKKSKMVSCCVVVLLLHNHLHVGNI